MVVMVRTTLAVRVITVVIVFVVRMCMHNVDLFLMWIRVDKDKQPARRTSFGLSVVVQALKSSSLGPSPPIRAPNENIY